MNEQCIQVNNLTKSFSGRKVINDLSFEVNKGEVFALLGHNGAGKSTTIDLILGLKCPDEGNATILGIDTLKKVSIGCFDDTLISVINLLVIAVICTSVAVKTFRWE